MIEGTESVDPAPTGASGEDEAEPSAASAEVADTAAPEKIVALSRDNLQDASDGVADESAPAREISEADTEHGDDGPD